MAELRNMVAELCQRVNALQERLATQEHEERERRREAEFRERLDREVNRALLQSQYQEPMQRLEAQHQESIKRLEERMEKAEREGGKGPTARRFPSSVPGWKS